MQMPTTHSSFDQYYISHKTISHLAVCSLQLCNKSWRRHWRV